MSRITKVSVVRTSERGSTSDIFIPSHSWLLSLVRFFFVCLCLICFGLFVFVKGREAE